MRVKELFAFMKERQSIYDKKTAGKPKPWTKDPILQRYKFCNIYREQDTVTKWFAANWRTPYQHDDYLWFAFIVGRFINEPTALMDISYPVPWDQAYYCRVMNKRKWKGAALFRGAYNSPNCIGEVNVSKHISFATKLFTPLWDRRGEITNHLEKCDTLASAFQVINAQWALGSFMAGQVIADLKFTPRWKDAPDWWTFAVSGPGSRRGLNVVLDRPPEAKWKEAEWQAALQQLQKKIDPLIEKAGMPRLSAQDLQGCLCELFKYNRGYSRSRYPGNVV